MSLTKSHYMEILEEFYENEGYHYWQKDMDKRRELIEKVLNRIKTIMEEEGLILMYKSFDDMTIKEDGTLMLPIGDFSKLESQVLSTFNI